MAYAWMLERDFGRFLDCEKRADACPLGAGALAGTTFPIKRERIAELLGFSSIYENSLDAVSDRDFVVECVAASSLCMVHLSRLCEEIVLWTSGEFRFARLHDSYATGSSIMPQKKNADHAELIRGKSGRVFGSLITLLTVLKGLPLAYNKDMQEDKEALFDSVRTLSGALKIMSGMIETMTFNREHMERAAAADFSNATDMADYLARKGMPFREAHEVTAKLVAQCVESGKTLESIPLPDLQSLSSLFQEDIFEALRTERVVSRRTSRGGTAQSRVVEQIERFEKLISLSA
jgi:argininosuccinate lyase